MAMLFKSHSKSSPSSPVIGNPSTELPMSTDNNGSESSNDQSQQGESGAALSTTSSYSSFADLESSSSKTGPALPAKRKDGTISRSNSVSQRLKGLFHKSPQNSSLHLPLSPKQPMSPDRLPSPRAEHPTGVAASTAGSTQIMPKSQRAVSPPLKPVPNAASPITEHAASASSPALPIDQPVGPHGEETAATARPEMRKSLSNSDISGSLAKLKLQMPPVIENDIDEVLEEAENPARKPVPMSREPTSSTAATTKQIPQTRGRVTVRAKNTATSGSDSSVGSRSRSASRKREPTLHSSNNVELPKEVLEKLKTVKHHKDGHLIIFDEGIMPHIHDYTKLKKDPIQTSPSGILSSLIRVKKNEVNAQDHMHDMKLESAISLLPDNYAEELIAFKAKPENFRYNYEDYLNGEESESDSEYETDSDYDPDEDIDPIIGDAQLDIINRLVDKIEHIDKHKEKLISAKRLKLIEKYGKIQGIVGKGSYGIVKLAVKPLPNKTQRIFAIKELKQKSNENVHHFSNRLTSEFMISSSLTHQSIINTYDLMVDLASNTYLQVMDYVPCGDLFSLVHASNGDGLNPIEADCFFKQILNAVSYLHSVGISHNDLKVENLLLTATGQLKIIDFGNSTPVKCAWENRCSKLSGPQGSEPYCGPEMFVQKDYDPRLADIWSLGVIYLVMVNGGYVWKIPNAKSDGAYEYYLDNRPSDENPKGSYDVIDGLAGKNKNNKKRILYAMLDPNPETRIRLHDIWKCKWVAGIEVCDAGKGLEPAIY